MEKMLFQRPVSYYEAHSALNTANEIARQPELWRELADTLCANQSEITAFMDRVTAIPGLRIVFTGAGSSAFVGESLRSLLAIEMGLRAEAIDTTDIISSPDSTLYDAPTLLISYARSGESPESTATLRFAKKRIRELYQVVIVCNRDSALSRAGEADANTLVLHMPQASCDLGFAMTSSVSCMALATWCLFHHRQLPQYAGYLAALADSMEADFPTLDDAARRIAAYPYRRIIWLGTGALKGLAREGAVKSMELTDGYVFASYDAPTGFRHGPKTVINNETLTVHFLSALPYSRQYDIDLAREVNGEKAGNRVVVVDAQANAVPGADVEALYTVPDRLPANCELCAYLKGLVFLQLLSMEKSLERGYTTDSPCKRNTVNRVVQGVVIYEI